MIETVLVFEGQGARSVPGGPNRLPIDLATMTPAEAQRAIVLHQVNRAEACLAEADTDTGGRFAVLGQSLGEVSAFVVSGALGLADALDLVRLRAELPASMMPARAWTMASMTRLLYDRAEQATRGLPIWMIGRNAPSDCVVVGETEAFAVFVERVDADPATYRELPVVHPYHTPMMEPVARAIGEHVAQLSVEDPRVEVISPTGPCRVRTAIDVREVLVQALTRPVAWSDALVRAADRWHGARWRECGPSGSLHRFVWKNGLRLDWADA